MKAIIIAIYVVLINVSLCFGQTDSIVNSNEEEKIVDYFEPQILCSQAFGEKYETIEITDTMLTNNIDAIANYIITFDAKNDLLVRDIKLIRITFLTNPREIIDESDKRFKKYNMILTPKIEELKFWKGESNGNEFLSNSYVFGFSITIKSGNVW